MMLRAKFQLLNRFLTIPLHLCCSSAPPRFAHETISMRSAQSCDFCAENCSCSGQHLYKSCPFCTSNLVHSIPMQRNPTFSKCFRYCCISTKVLLSIRRVPTFRANAGTSIAIDQICVNKKETTSGFEKWDIPSASITSILHEFPFTACAPPDSGPRPDQVLGGTP